MNTQPTRRQFLELAAGGVGLAFAGASTGASVPAQEVRASGKSESGAMNLLTDPRFQVGAKSRMQQFIGRGADPKEAEAIFSRLTDLEPQRWVTEWTRLAEPLEQRGTQFEKEGNTAEAMKAFKQASLYYSIAKFPVLNHSAKQAAYKKCTETYLKAGRYFDPPVERVTIPFEGKEIIGYLRIPKGASKPPVMIATGGIDVYNEDRDTTDFLNVGMATFSMDMPGAGQSPLWYMPDSGRAYSAAIDYLLTRADLDARRLGIMGRSYGGYWAAKMAFIESKRIRAAVDWGGPAHFTFQEPWVRGLLNDKLYLWQITDSMIYTHHVKDLNELIQKAPSMSLQTEGLLEKPCAPLLNVNGVKDPWITIEDSYLLIETGEPKSSRLYANGGHMGGDPGTSKMIANWIKARVSA